MHQAIDAIVLIDGENKITFFNTAAERLWGYSAADVLGQNVKCLVPRSIREEHDNYIANNRATGINRIVGTSREIQIECRDGSVVVGLLSISKVNVDGTAQYMAVVRDISDQVRQREEIELLSLAVNETDRIVLIVNADRRIVYVNRAFTEAFGYTWAEAQGQLPSELLVSPRTDPHDLEQLRLLARQNLAFRYDILAAAKSGKELWISSITNPVLDANGGVRNLVSVLMDITEQREIESLQRTLLEALASGLPFANVAEVLCRHLGAIVPDVVPSVTIIDVQNRLRPIAGPNLPQAYRDAIDGISLGETMCGCGTAARRGTPILTPDIAADPRWAGCRDSLLACGLRACWSYPVLLQNKRVACTFDFFFKGAHAPSPLLQRVLDACLHLCMLAIESEEKRAEIARLAHFDTLTGLPNRTHTYERIDGYIREAESENLAVILLDLDNFKDINDALGHPTGDKVLIEVANRIEGLWGERGSVGRMDGDTFAVVVRRCSLQHAPAVAEELLDELKKPFDIDGFSVRTAASIGVSLYPSDGAESSTLIQNADIALHRSKTLGRAKYTFFDREMNQVVEERLKLGAKLRTALSSGLLELHYQPQIASLSGEVLGVEALARWTDDEFGAVSPAKFIPLAEDMGEIGEIGRWSLREACRQLAAWRAEGLAMPSASVNVSAKHFRGDELPGLIAGLLQEFRLAPASLIIEITETAMMDAGPETFETITKVRQLGVGLSMDDFGTGFSSLARLAQLPVTEIKIDRGFMQGFERNDAKKAITTAAIRVGQSLGLNVVAEGVETEEQRALLLSLGCDAIQGFLISRPLPPADLARWLRTAG